MKRVILITGSIRGIGKEVAKSFMNEGDFVILNSSRSENEVLEELNELSIDFKDKFTYCKFDITNREEVAQGISKIVSRYGKIDVLVNNAGITKDRTLVKLEHSMWDDVINVNLTGAFNMCKEVVPHMIENKAGRILNISSVIGLSGNFGQTNYAASKAGLIGFTKSLALEVARYGITVNAIAPGFIHTDMTKELPKEVIDKMTANIPLRCFGEPSDVANVVKFLSKGESRYITGETISVNGGLYLD